MATLSAEKKAILDKAKAIMREILAFLQEGNTEDAAKRASDLEEYLDEESDPFA